MLPNPGELNPEELLALMLSLGMLPTEPVLLSQMSPPAPPPGGGQGLWVYIPPKLAERLIVKLLKAALKSGR